MSASPDRASEPAPVPDERGSAAASTDAHGARFANTLARATRRVRWIAALTGTSAGLVVASATVAAAGRGPAALAIAVGSVAAATLAAAAWRYRTAGDAAVAAIERTAPASRNLVRTAAEIQTGRVHASPRVSRHVIARADALIDRRAIPRALPASRSAAFFAAAAGIFAAAWIVAGRPAAAGPVVARPSSDHAAVILRVRVDVAPPEYAAGDTTSFDDPSRISALAGSRLRIIVGADAAGVSLVADAAGATGDSIALTPVASREFAGDVVLATDGFLSITPVSSAGEPGEPRLIPISATPDELPRVRIVAPGRDLLVPDGNRAIDVAIEADDDVGMQALGLAYTRVSGSGENFTFTDGELPIDIERRDARNWRARASWNLAPLALEPGDLVIYRATARDRRPGAAAAESDAFIVEIAAPGSLAGDGFAIDDRENRYAISQQMVILKTERLIAARATLSRDDFEHEAGAIAAEQRQVRAEFVFMMGGELIDEGLDPTQLHEHAEAEKEDELAAGRLRNQGRADLMAAIRFMSRAAAALADANPAAALPIEKEALTYLQRAFSRNRYILRTLTERERLDMSRRLTGVLAALARHRRPAAIGREEDRVVAIRALLADVLALASDSAGAPEPPARAVSTSELARRALAIDSAPGPVADAAAALGRSDFDAAARHLTIAAARLMPAATSRPGSAALDGMAGVFADRLRQASAVPVGAGGRR